MFQTSYIMLSFVCFGEIDVCYDRKYWSNGKHFQLAKKTSLKLRKMLVPFYFRKTSSSSSFFFSNALSRNSFSAATGGHWPQPEFARCHQFR